MAADEFFNRWARKNQQAKPAPDENLGAPFPDATTGSDPALPQAGVAAPDPFADRQPTLDDVDQLQLNGDFSPFVKHGVDESVKRSALKKLFTDPHFNVMDGLDIYIGDYTQSDPIPPEMLAMLNHAKDLFNPPGLNGKRILEMLNETPPEPEAALTNAVPEPAEAQDLSVATSEAECAEEADRTDELHPEEKAQITQSAGNGANANPASSAGPVSITTTSSDSFIPPISTINETKDRQP